MTKRSDRGRVERPRGCLFPQTDSGSSTPEVSLESFLQIWLAALSKPEEQRTQFSANTSDRHGSGRSVGVFRLTLIPETGTRVSLKMTDCSGMPVRKNHESAASCK